MSQELAEYKVNELMSRNINDLGQYLTDNTDIYPIVECPMDMLFSDDVCIRKIFMPAGTMIVSQIHLKDHITIVVSGLSKVVDEQGNEELIEGLRTFKTPAGRQRALYIITDSIWITAHGNQCKSIEEFEDKMVKRPDFMNGKTLKEFNKELIKCQS